jgi:hypothetical protein
VCASPSAELIAFQELVSQEAAAFALFNAAENAHDEDAIAKAGATQQGAHERIVILSDAICARPTRSWADVAERAQIAHYWQDRRPDGSLSGLASKYAGDRVNAHLISAMLALAEGSIHA